MLRRQADGSMRDALSLLDQCIAFYLGQELTYDKVLEVLGAVDTEVFSQLASADVLEQDVTRCIQVIDWMIFWSRTRDWGSLSHDFTWYLRNLLLVKSIR